MNIDDAWKAPAGLLLATFKQRCLDHPRFADDPECVLATLYEQIRHELDECVEPPLHDLVKPVRKPQALVRHQERNGKGR